MAKKLVVYDTDENYLWEQTFPSREAFVEHLRGGGPLLRNQHFEFFESVGKVNPTTDPTLYEMEESE